MIVPIAKMVSETKFGELDFYMDVPAVRFANYAVNRDPVRRYLWNLTHIPTKLAIISSRDRRGMIKVARYMSDRYPVRTSDADKARRLLQKILPVGWIVQNLEDIGGNNASYIRSRFADRTRASRLAR